jgi:hypothetical protein
MMELWLFLSSFRRKRRPEPKRKLYVQVSVFSLGDVPIADGVPDRLLSLEDFKRLMAAAHYREGGTPWAPAAVVTIAPGRIFLLMPEDTDEASRFMLEALIAQRKLIGNSCEVHLGSLSRDFEVEEYPG